MTLLTVIGTRPQFIKAAAVHRALVRRQESASLRHVLVHTGQHYDHGMSAVFFADLGLPAPDHDLGVGSGPQGQQTGQMLARIEEVLVREQPNMVVVYGDTNSTLGGALAAVKLHIPVAHVEAGLRSFNRAMPEEINRVIVDHVSSLLFCPTLASVDLLAREGVVDGVHLVGDVMHESALHFATDEDSASETLGRFGVRRQAYALVTVHRAENTNAVGRLASIMRAVQAVARRVPVVWPVHPRTLKVAREAGPLDGAPLLQASGGSPRAGDGLIIVEPLPYPDMLRLERHAAVILTDSGGVQREAGWFGTPCVTLRDETEWTDTLDSGRNILAGAETEAILTAFDAARQVAPRGAPAPAEPAADRIAGILLADRT